MSDILKALAVSGSILLPVVILVTVISIAAVRRGEAAMGGHDLALPGVPGTPVAAVATPAATGKAAAVAEISVLQILFLGFVLFALTMGLLTGISVIQHMH